MKPLPKPTVPASRFTDSECYRCWLDKHVTKLRTPPLPEHTCVVAVELLKAS